jgi:hypothetical protein
MTSYTNDIGKGIVMAAQTIIKIIFCFQSMPAAVSGYPVGPVDIAVVLRHNHFDGMTVHTEGLFLVTGQAVLLVAPGQKSVVIPEIEGMGHAVQIVPLMTFLAIIFLVAMTAAVCGELCCDSMFFVPVQAMIRRSKLHRLVVTIQAF